jgi:hypothetical protein
MANKVVAMQGMDGTLIPIVAVDQGDGTYVLGSSASIATGDLEIGAVEIKNPTNDTRAVVGANGLYVDLRNPPLPAALAAGGGMKIEGVAGGVAVPASDAGAAWTSVLGVSGAVAKSADAQAGYAVTDAPTSGQKLVITDVMISAAVALTVWLTEETSGTEFARFYLAAGSSVQFTPRAKFKLNTANKKLIAVASGAGNVAITTMYYSEA